MAPTDRPSQSSLLPPSSQFLAAAEWLSSSPRAKRFSNNQKLEVYSLYKIRTVSLRPKPGTRPGLLEWTGSAKWDAWDKAGKHYEGKPIEEVEKRYIKIAEEQGFTIIPTAQADSTIPPSEGTDDIDLENLSDDSDHEPRISYSKKGKASTEGEGLGVFVSTFDQTDDDGDGQPDSIHSYALEGNIDKLKALLDSEYVDINGKDENGYSALHLACDRGQLEAVKLLLANGADAYNPDADGNTPLEVAKIASREDIVDLLEEVYKSRPFKAIE
ncbi:ankyrin repeat-containing domain protein [Cantharellus anzutake]|uniref:ankyrin repeat-containing domain protein n=1 Tax=Cantharellus anzutake TaxID=1750568 RepID=UPI001907DCEF|nr:ankyrin repeat-containing domain protein [Cantharellus anzutake]KAF8344221.1 ankyrin repeat-containing domain protein [Cantharellus anzutake]